MTKTMTMMKWWQLLWKVKVGMHWEGLEGRIWPFIPIRSSYHVSGVICYIYILYLNVRDVMPHAIWHKPFAHISWWPVCSFCESHFTLCRGAARWTKAQVWHQCGGMPGLLQGLPTLPSLKHACSRGRPSLKAWLPMSKLCQDFKQPSNLEKSEGWVTGGWPGVIADHCNCWIIVVYSLNTEGYLFSVLPFCCLATEGWLHGKGLLVKQVFASPVSENTTERTSVGKGAARLKSWLCICILLQPCLWKESLYLPEVWWALKGHGLLCTKTSRLS